MIVSMTGYGKAFAELPGKKLVIEVKTLNSKGLDTNVKLPAAFRDKEPEVRTFLSQKLERGKIELFISTETAGDLSGYMINKALAKKYYLELHDLMAELHEENPENILGIIMRMPEVVQTDKYVIEEHDWEVVKAGISDAVTLVNDFRFNEGNTLENEFISRVGLILNLLDSIAPFEKIRLEEIKDRIRTGFQTLAQSEKLTVMPDENRFEQELIYYLEKLDITEEKVRLKKHCDYFMLTLHDEASQGKKLGFIVQEMGREINTIGSKANNAEIQKIVVQMKDELEKVKEQLLNIL
jgi:uncharacterized protein (TIGR00255 family)